MILLLYCAFPVSEKMYSKRRKLIKNESLLSTKEKAFAGTKITWYFKE